MPSLRHIAGGIRSLFRKKRAERELDEELRGFMDMAAEEGMKQGRSQKDALRAVRLERGSVDGAKEVVRAAGWESFLETFWQDLSYGIRMLRKSPGFTAVVILTLGLGIGANTAIFSVVDAVMLRPLPFQNPNQLVVVWHTPPPKSFPGVRRFVVSPANYIDWRRQNDVFTAMSAIGIHRANLTGMTQPESVQQRLVSYDFFSMLGVLPTAGRAFTSVDDQPGHGSVAILNWAFCQAHFGAPKNALRKTIQLNDRAYTIVGVMPPSFDFPFQAQLWTPLAWTDKEHAVRGDHNYIVIARLKSGVNEAKAQADMNTISRRLAQQYPTEDAGWGALVVPLRDLLAGSIGPALLVLFGAVGFVLLIACANVANLLLTKALGRDKEMAIRAALGASRRRISRQVLSETALVSIAGGVAALLLAHFVVAAIGSPIAGKLPLSIEIGLNGWVLAFTFAICVLTAVIAGVAPAWHLTNTNVNESLKQSSGKTSADSRGRRARNSLVVSEVALSLVLLVGAGLTIETLYLLRQVNPGIDPHNVLTVPLAISQKRYPAVSQQTNFFQLALEHIRALPGVIGAAAVDSLPLTGGSTQPVQVEGQPPEAMADQPEAAVRVISPGYFSAMHISLMQGRDFTDADKAGAEPVVLVSESFARRFWPHENPIGRHVGLTFSSGPPRTVIGVVGDVKLYGLDVTQSFQTVYSPLLQNSNNPVMTVVVRTTTPPSSLIPAITSAVHQVDPQVPVTGVLTMDDIVDQSLSPQQLNMTLLAIFAGLALLLATIGIYGVQAYAVRHRVREIGIRLALGAQRRDILRLIIGQGLFLTGVGICGGLVLAVGLTRLMASQLYGVTATDPLTLAAVVVVLTLVALAACYVPARRAMKVDPTVALRYE
ncbi:MAG TPA: ABC transporter permease [Candidatus Acidoferrales bacterium]|nr:ABC transporter permease [Candidatus Acidoferrales bacterium]